MLSFLGVYKKYLARKTWADTSALERQIDEMVYALYALTPEEIEIVEGKR